MEREPAQRLREALHEAVDAVVDMLEQRAAVPPTAAVAPPPAPKAAPPELPLTLSVDEAAGVLRVPRSTVYHAIARGYLPHVKLGRRLLVPRDGLLAAMGAGQLGAK